MNMWCLHGNLQRASVWQPFEGKWTYTVNGRDAPVSLRCPDLWADRPIDFRDWTRVFCSRVSADSNGSPNWLLGYSLGGRLALHALIENPELWAGVIVVGAHPGLTSATERREQLKRDRMWARRFLEDPWDEVLTAWDALPVFCGRPNTIPRPEEAFSRERIAHFFEVFSKGNQDNLLPALSSLSGPPVLYVTGEEDVTYNRIANHLSACCQIIEHAIVPEAGHRAPWEATPAFCTSVQRFIST